MQAVVVTPEIAPVERALRVLVVDDQEVICELICEYLHCDGHTTASAYRGDEAYALFSTDKFDLVITDQSMPGMNGVQLASVIKEVAAEIPVILLTGFGDEMLAAGGLPAGIDLVLGKPVSQADLRLAIFQALNGRESLASVA